MWRCLLIALPLLAAAACSAKAGDPAGDREEAPAPVDGGPLSADGSAPADATPVAVTLTQSSSQEITPDLSIACFDGGADPDEHRENSFYRVFDLAEMGVTGRLETSAVAVGIQSAQSPAPPQPMSVLLHTLAGNELEVDRLTQIGRADVTVPNRGAGILDVPLAASAEPGSKLVVEIFLPDAAGAGHLLFPGTNDAPQSGPTYLRAPITGCDLVEPTDLADIGFADRHLVVSVTGTAY